jgi:peptidoglycan L-alanyl-D-glutamate endopeptidase CwlK
MAVDLQNPTARNSDLSILHPTVRKAIDKVLKALAAEKIPLFVFEAWRSPARQHYLYAQGRTREGKIVTYQDSWGSYHQYGLAVDLVFGGPGKWTWNEPKKGMWARMHQIGREHGLMPLSFETPHLQLAGTSSHALYEGKYPDGGDEAWAGNLAMAISAWTGKPKSPPLPGVVDRPALDELQEVS